MSESEAHMDIYRRGQAAAEKERDMAWDLEAIRSVQAGSAMMAADEAIHIIKQLLSALQTGDAATLHEAEELLRSVLPDIERHQERAHSLAHPKEFLLKAQGEVNPE